MTKNISMREWEALSAYLDGQLPAKERIRLETQLNQAPELRSALEDLRRTRAVLRSQPKVRAPRNFTLTPDMAGLKARPARRAPAYPFFRLASALATFLFLLVLVGDLTGLPSRLGFGGAAQPAQVAMAPAAEPLESASGLSESYPEPTQAANQAFQAQSSQAENTQAPMMMKVPTTPTPSPAATSEAPRAAMPIRPTPEGTPFGVAGGGLPPTSSVTEAPPAAAAMIASPSPATEDHAYPAAGQPAETQPAGFSPLRAVEVVLALLAVASGLVAFLLRRVGSA
jgi:negative regulator of sigma E activity